MVNVKVKWGKKEYEVEMNASEGVSKFKSQLQGLTNVPPERQKLMGKGLWTGILKDDADLSSMKVNAGHVITLMGTADVMKAPAATVVFVEDMTDAEKAEKGAVLPAGLKNLGNSCYMNSVLQCVRNMSELREALDHVPSVPRSTHETNVLLSGDLKDTLNQLDRSAGSHIPMFVPSIREKNPLFNQRGSNGGFMQQDAEEFFNSLMQIIAAGLGAVGSNLEEFLEMELETKLSCQESQDEAETTTRERACKLVCNIQGSVGADGVAPQPVNHLHEGLQLALSGTVEKNSDVLGRNAIWSKKQKISKLPRYLCVQFMRFFWKATPDSRDHAGVKCKIVRAVNFTQTIDVYDMCTEKVQEGLCENRLADEREENLKLAKKRGLDEEEAKKSSPSSSTSMDVDVTSEATAASGKADMEVADDMDDEAALAAALAMSVGNGSGDGESTVFQKAEGTTQKKREYFNKGVPDDFSGIYELFGVVTHKGRDADSGHYIGWVRQAEGSDTWWRFDDDVVTEVLTAEIMALRGGGDWHTAYLNFYRASSKKR